MSSATSRRRLANDLADEIQRLKEDVVQGRNSVILGLAALGFSCVGMGTLMADALHSKHFVDSSLRYLYLATSGGLLSLLIAQLAAVVSWNDWNSPALDRPFSVSPSSQER